MAGARRGKSAPAASAAAYPRWVPRRFSRWIGGPRIGADFFERRGAVARAPSGADPRGVVDALADLSHPGIDTARVHPAVARFFEDTAGLVLDVESHWRFPFSLLWRVARPAARAIGQFVLPVARGRIVTRVAALDAARDGRPGARAVVRTYDDGAPFQAVAYAVCVRGGVHLMSAAFPQPGGHVAGFLRLDPQGDAGDDAGIGVVLSSSGRGDGAGVWLVVGGLPIPSPFSERLALFPPGAPGAPDAARVPGTVLVGRHEQRLFGVLFVTHDYWFTPAAGAG